MMMIMGLDSGLKYLFHVPRATSSPSEQSVDPSGPKIYNAIPADMRCNEQYDSYKYRYKQCLLFLLGYAH